MKNKQIKYTICVDNDSYELGMRDAWELAGSVYHMGVNEICKVFGDRSLKKVFEEDVKSVMGKVTEYLKERVRPGEIIECDGVRYIVLSVNQFGYHCINGSTFGSTMISFQCSIIRTGDTNLDFVEAYNE